MPLEALRSYRALSLGWEQFRQAVEETTRDLEALLERQAEQEEPWFELCRGSAETLREFLAQATEEQLDGLERQLEELESSFLEHDLGECYRQLELGHQWAKLNLLLDEDIEQALLVEGYYGPLEADCQRWMRGELSAEGVRQALTEQLAHIEWQIEEHEATYLTPEEWTVEVFLADRLLSEGLSEWREGLLDLLARVDRSHRELRPGLERLLEANRKLIQVDRLNSASRRG